MKRKIEGLLFITVPILCFMAAIWKIGGWDLLIFITIGVTFVLAGTFCIVKGITVLFDE